VTKRIQRAQDYILSRAQIDDSGRVDRRPQWYQVITALLDEGEPGPLGRNWTRCHTNAGRINFSAPLPNVHLYATCCNQPELDRNAQILLQTPAAVRGVNIEPMLGAMDLLKVHGIEGSYGCSGTHRHLMPHDDGSRGDLPHHHHDQQCKYPIHSVILGGESGPGARPMHLYWARKVRDQCVKAGVPFFFKQWGGWRHLFDYYKSPDIVRDTALRVRGVQIVQHNGKVWDVDGQPPPGCVLMTKSGKARAGRMLDGREWNELLGKESK
jgi:hypothetical protein